jgi:flavin reductase (DIM6/NTAB) family NADH-FMN oxidoreductase RutF
MSDIVALFHHLTTGFYVIGVSAGGVRDAFAAAAVTQVSNQPRPERGTLFRPFELR